MSRIYLDYASLTPIDPRVLREMRRYSSPEYANPSSIYREGVVARKAMGDGRERIARTIHAHGDEIVFTSGGTEANSLALEGAARAAFRSGNIEPHLIISNIEHSSIMEAAAMLERQGTEVTRLAVGSDGRVDIGDLRKAIRPETFMISIMAVNNEIGTIQPIREIAKEIRAARKRCGQTEKGGQAGQVSRYPLLHTDAAQAALYLDLNVEQLGVDLLTLDGSKVYGPRGIGALYVRRGTPIEPIIYGGGQEDGMRSSTENLPAIMGFARALDIACADHRAFGTKNVPKSQVREGGGCAGMRSKESRRLQALKGIFCAGLKKIHSDIQLNPLGASIDSSTQIPSILNVSIPGIDNEFFVLQLDAAGVAVSTKSSCLRDADESYVLQAIGADSRTSVRFSFGRWTRSRDAATTLRIIAKILKV